MDQELINALFILSIMVFGLICGVFLYLRRSLMLKDIDSQRLRAFCCIKFREENVLHFAKSEEDLEHGKKSIFYHLEHLADNLKSPFRTPVSPVSPISPEIQKALEAWSRNNHNNQTLNLAHLDHYRQPIPEPSSLSSTPESGDSSTKLRPDQRRFST